MSYKGSKSAIIVKAMAGYECQECGSNELVSSHHQTPGDDSTQICLCASCHADKHPEVPRALFFSNNGHRYWFNKPAAKLAKEEGVCSRTIIRIAKQLGIPRGDLSISDEALLVGHLKGNQILERETKRRKMPWRRKLTCKRCGYQWMPYVKSPLTCPECRSPFWNKKRIKGGK